MRHFEQLSNGEAANALGVSEAAAGMRHLRALRRLRTVLDEMPSLGG
jgi:RNA polymerase sigma-70 factor (ECF subfamily)